MELVGLVLMPPPAALLGQRAAAIGNHLVTSQPGIITTVLNLISPK
jgi:ABC-type thiamin/hydroxymethylpyrimidine transport system permease subunit